jgi:hypothetical protein
LRAAEAALLFSLFIEKTFLSLLLRETSQIYASKYQSRPDNLDPKEAFPQEHDGEEDGHQWNESLIHARPGGSNLGDTRDPKHMGHGIR